MRRKILIIGNSHVAAFILGWNILNDKYGSENKIEFISTTAQVWHIMNQCQGFFAERGVIRSNSDPREYIKKAGILNEIPSFFREIEFSPSAYDVVLFVDLNLRLRPDQFLESNSKLICYNLIPTSISCLLDSSLFDIPPHDCRFSFSEKTAWMDSYDPMEVVRLAMKEAPSAQFYYLSRPIEPARNAKFRLKDKLPCSKKILNAVDAMEFVMSAYCEQNKMTFINRSEKVICPETGFTDNTYSRSFKVKKDTEFLDSHMGSNYGVEQISNFLKILGSH